MSVVNHLPYFTQGTVVSGFGRGSKELGIPTANLPDDVIHQLPQTFECGVYYGWASVDGIDDVHKMVLSVGMNVYFDSNQKTMEIHIMKKFDTDFYAKNLRIIVLGFIRPMRNFDSLDDLITAINEDIQEGDRQLAMPENLTYKFHPFFSPPNPVSTTSAPGSVSAAEVFNSPDRHINDKQSTKPGFLSEDPVDCISNGHRPFAGSRNCAKDMRVEGTNTSNRVREKTSAVK